MARLRELKRLYNSGLSMKEVGEKLEVSIWAVNNAMRRNGLSRRKVFETRKIQFYKSPLTFNEKKYLTQKEEKLKIAGLTLYWAEGGKRGKSSIDFANCDEMMITLFLKFLRKIYGVLENKLRVLLYCYSDQNPDSLIEYWSDLTKISKSQFTKPYVKTAPDSRVHGKMEHGLVHIRYSDMRLLSKIMQEIGQLTGIL